MKVGHRTFIVSGGSSGLGLATVHDLLSSNAYISIVDRSPPPSDHRLATNHVKFFQTDITQSHQVESAVEGTVEWSRKTGMPLGGVINCAGVGSAAKFVDRDNNPHSLDLWNFVIAVNLTGAFNLTRLALKHLVRVSPENDDDNADGERGVVIFVSSSAAFEGQPGQTAYAASKGALRSMTLPLARDLARYAIRVVDIAPGVFASSMTAQFSEKTRRSLDNNGLVYPRRFGKPEEFARTVKWVLECPYVNGETVRLSGAGRLPAKL